MPTHKHQGTMISMMGQDRTCKQLLLSVTCRLSSLAQRAVLYRPYSMKQKSSSEPCQTSVIDAKPRQLWVMQASEATDDALG